MRGRGLHHFRRGMDDSFHLFFRVEPPHVQDDGNVEGEIQPPPGGGSFPVGKRRVKQAGVDPAGDGLRVYAHRAGHDIRNGFGGDDDRCGFTREDVQIFPACFFHGFIQPAPVGEHSGHIPREHVDGERGWDVVSLGVLKTYPAKYGLVGVNNIGLKFFERV